MKKRLLASIMAVCIVLSLVGCDTKEEAAVSAIEETATEEVTTEETAATSDAPVFGGENAEGYEGFEYLREKNITSETKENNETGKKEGTSLCVYIPDEQNAIVYGRNAESTSLGVHFRVELNPDWDGDNPGWYRENPKDYLPAENLD